MLGVSIGWIMLRIGLTGGVGSGKSTVARCFAKRHIDVIDADQIAHELTQPATDITNAIIAHFGATITSESSKIDRARLRQVVFDQPDQRQWLEQLLHPAIRDRMQQMIDQATSSYCILVIPLLIEAGVSRKMIDRILVVDVPESMQIERTCQRDQLSKEQVRKIMLSQSTREQRLVAADDIINNENDLIALDKQVQQLHQTYIKLARQCV